MFVRLRFRVGIRARVVVVVVTALFLAQTARGEMARGDGARRPAQTVRGETARTARGYLYQLFTPFLNSQTGKF